MKHVAETRPHLHHHVPTPREPRNTTRCTQNEEGLRWSEKRGQQPPTQGDSDVQRADARKTARRSQGLKVS